MEKYAVYNRVLNSSNVVALATSVGNVPNVRLLTCVHDEDKPGIIYFATENNSRKVEEFWDNSRVALTSIPSDGVCHIRSNDAVIEKSALTVYDLRDKFAAAHKGYDGIIESVGDVLDVYEISIKNCLVCTEMDKFEAVSFQ